jgi:hypothetical protein
MSSNASGGVGRGDLAPGIDDGDDGLAGEVLFAKAGLLHAGAVAEAPHVVGAKPTVTTEFLGTFGHPRYDIGHCGGGLSRANRTWSQGPAGQGERAWPEK